jgi:hypothetical protein
VEIKNKEIEEALNRSGYFLESRVLSDLSKKGYKNFPNETYPDPITDKSREIDIISKGLRLTENLSLNDFLNFEFTYDLVIECINNTQPVAFFKRPDKDPYTIFNKFYYSKTFRDLLPLYDGRRGGDYEFDDYTTSSKNFHYNLMPKNTQYCSFSLKKGKKNEWMASHPDGLNDTFGKLLDFVEHSTTKTDKRFTESNGIDAVRIKMMFPVLILQNRLIEVSETKGKIEIEDKNHLIYNSKQYSDKKDGFLIDIITEDYLAEYLNLVKNSMTNLKSKIVDVYRDIEVVARKSKTTGFN